MTKDEFIKTVSKIDSTGEDDFKAIYNSPEKIWDLVVSKAVNKDRFIHDVMAMLPAVTFLEKVNRVEVIDQKGRSYVNWKPTNKTELSLQDGGETLKVFISNDR